MSSLTIHGKLLFAEEPVYENGSMLMVIAVGKEKKESSALIQTTNKIIVRVPPRPALRNIASKLNPNDYVQVIGHIRGNVERSIGTNSQTLNVEVVAAHIEPCRTSPLVKESKIENLLFANWIGNGRVRAVKEPAKEGVPGVLYLQISTDRQNANRRFQQSGVVPILVYPHLWERVQTLATPHQPILVNTRVSGVIKKSPRIGEMGEYDSKIQANLVLDRITPCALVPESFYSEPLSPGKDTEKAAKAAKEKAKKEAQESDVSS